MAKVIAQRGDNVFMALMSVAQEGDEDAEVAVVDTTLNIWFKDNLQEVLKLGYWDVDPTVGREKQEIIDLIVENDPVDDTVVELTKEVPYKYRKDYFVYQDDKKIGKITFGGEIVFEITSRDDNLLELVSKHLVDPTEIKDKDGGTIYTRPGDFQFEEAMLLVLEGKGYVVKARDAVESS